jgi:hypothetical protein
MIVPLANRIIIGNYKCKINWPTDIHPLNLGKEMKKIGIVNSTERMSR